MEVFKSKRVITALVLLAVAIAASYGLNVPEEALVGAVLDGDTVGALEIVIGALLGLLGGYGAAKAKTNKE